MKRKWIGFRLLPLLVAATAAASGEPIDSMILAFPPKDSPAHSAYQLFSEGRLMESLELYYPLAEKGDPDAHFLMGLAADLRKEGGSQGPSKLQSMARHYGLAAAGGNPDAPLRYQLMALMGGDEQQRESARKDLEAAANEDGNVQAWRVFGEACLRGGVTGTPDPAKAIQWWTKAADKGDEWVLVPLGALILREKKSTDDETVARKWLEKAVQQGNANAFYVLGGYEADSLKNPEAAEREYRRGAEAGQADCMLKLSELLDRAGKAEEGKSWLEKAAAAGNPKARFLHGKHLAARGGEGLKAAFPFLIAAANDGVWQAQFDVGMILFEGRLGYRDPIAAAAWLTKAATSGDPETQYQLGLIHEWGHLGSVNYSNVGILYSLACQAGHAKAAGRLARMAYDGIRVRSNPAQGWAYAKIAVERGDDTSKPLLSELDGKLTDPEKKEAGELYAKLLGETRVPPERVK